MYEDTTYEVILDRMLQRAKDNSPGIDTRQSSPIYTAMAPAAVELQNAYIGLDWTLDQMFAGTATREYLIKRCAEWNITPHPATKAVLKGEFNKDIEIGSRFSLGTLNYVAMDRIEEGQAHIGHIKHLLTQVCGQGYPECLLYSSQVPSCL